MINCEICGNEFTPRCNRKFRPIKFCSDICRKIDHRRVMRERKREERQIQKEIINTVYREIGTKEYYGKVDLTHDSWDFIPAHRANGKKVESYNRIGTVKETDLKIVNGRVRAAVTLERRIDNMNAKRGRPRKVDIKEVPKIITKEEEIVKKVVSEIKFNLDKFVKESFAGGGSTLHKQQKSTFRILEYLLQKHISEAVDDIVERLRSE